MTPKQILKKERVTPVTHINSEDFAIIIGIDSYTILPPLSGAAKDATDFAHWLQDPNGGGLPFKNIELILSPVKTTIRMPRPTQFHVDEALKRFRVISRKRIGRRLYFYFSGHGYADIDDVGMFMANASDNQANLNLGLDQYRKFLLRWGFFDEIIFILDCCRGPIEEATTQAPSFTLKPPFPSPMPKVNGYFVLATLAGLKSYNTWDEAEGRKRGILTRAILEGLRDQLATDSKGRITTSSLKQYLDTRVETLARENKLEQSTQIYTTHKEIVFKDGILKTKRIALQVPKQTSELTFINDDFVEIGKYTFFKTEMNGQFTYLVNDESLKSYVQPAGTIIFNEATIELEITLLQNARYGLKFDNKRTEILDLTKEQQYEFT